jgi:hypothetical protein
VSLIETEVSSWQRCPRGRGVLVAEVPVPLESRGAWNFVLVTFLQKFAT